MIDLKRLRQDPEGEPRLAAAPARPVRRAAARRRCSSSTASGASCWCRRRRSRRSGTRRARRWRAGSAPRSRPTSSWPGSRPRARRSRRSTPGCATSTTELDRRALAVPNFPAAETARRRRAANRVVRTWGEPPRFDFTPRPHWELGAALGILDLPAGRQARRLAGSRSCAAPGARLVRALASFMLDLHTREHGYEEVAPPYLVNRATLTGTGQLPKFEDDLYGIAVGRPVPHSDGRGAGDQHPPGRDSRRRADLPLGYCAWTPCFRREAGAHGKDTRGLIRVHQFDKVELVRFSRPEDSAAEHERMTGHAETVLQRLELPYRVLELAAGDTGFASARTFDLEVWAAGVGHLARGVELEHVHRFPGPPRQHPLPAGAQGQARVRAHAQRLGRRVSPHDHRPPGEQPSGRRVGAGAGGTGAVPRCRPPGSPCVGSGCSASRPRWPCALVALLAGLSLGSGLLVLRHFRADATATSRLYSGVFGGLNDPRPGAEAEALLRLGAQVRALGPAAGGHRHDRAGDRRGQPAVPGAARRPARAGVRRRGSTAGTRRSWTRRSAPCTTARCRPSGTSPRSRSSRALTIAVMVAVAVFAYRSAIAAQRDRLWVAMAREAAHQMGTPLTSLQGWIERVRSRPAPPPDLAEHLAADAERLDRVAQRFERIGNPAKREPVGLGALADRVARLLPAAASQAGQSHRAQAGSARHGADGGGRRGAARVGAGSAGQERDRRAAGARAARLSCGSAPSRAWARSG